MHGQLPVVWDRAEGFQVFDSWGNCWIDFTSTIFVANAGHGNPRICAALEEVVKKPNLHTYTYGSPERAEYLEYLIENTPENFEKAYLLSAGTEAVEAALKLMRLNGQKAGKKRGGILCFEGNWHGRTLGAQMMGGNASQKDWIGYLDPNLFHLPFPYPWNEHAVADPAAFFEQSLEALCAEQGLSADEDICGIMFETFQGWGAVFYPEEYVQAAQAFAKKHNILIAFDEMQSGFGRTGKLFGYMHYGVMPDLICCGKGASSSLPLSFVLGPASILDLPDIGSMSSTHSANPMVCAAGKANLEALIEDGLIDNAATQGETFQQRLNDLASQVDSHKITISGKGLVAAVIIHTRDGQPASDLCDRVCVLAMQRGLLVVNTGRESIKLAPPLCITEEAMAEGLEVFADAVHDAIAEMA